MTGPKWLSLGHPQQSVISVIVSYVSASDMENINKNNAYDAYDGYDAFSKGVTGLTFNKEKRPPRCRGLFVLCAELGLTPMLQLHPTAQGP